jgi:hypothetical protein
MILITSKTKYKVLKASKQFKDKFVFYSPSITTATDFSIDSAQDVFIYIKGGTITSDESYQQATRTRNIRKLYCYCEAEQQEPKYENVEQIKELMHNTLITCREINCISTSLCNYQDPTTHEMCMHETITFNNWAYNEYVKDCYNTNLLTHFEQLLDKQGFVCDVPLGTPQRLDKPTKERQSKLIQDISNDQFAKFLASDLGTRATDPQFEDIFIAINSLHLHEQDDQTLELYKDILTDPYKRHDHKHVIKLLQTDEALSKELAKLKKSTYEFKLLQTTVQKIKVLRQIEATYNIGFLDVTFEDNGAINMEDNLYRTIKLLFKSKRAKPTTKHSNYTRIFSQTPTSDTTINT